MSILLIWVQLLGAAAIILVAATSLAKASDVIALRTGLGRTFVGVILLATATSLPELATGMSSISLVGTPDLAAGDAFGSNLFNLLIIGLIDIFWRDGPILQSVSRTCSIVGILGIGVISFAALAMLVHSGLGTGGNWYISPLSVLLLLVFLGSLYIIFVSDKDAEANRHIVNGVDGTIEKGPEDRLLRAVFTYVVSAVFVIGAAVWLALTGDHLAKEMGWDASFVGTQFLAFSTSLPELAASFAAIRIRAPELAISNVLGSNLFNMGFVLFVDDLAYTEGSLWFIISHIHVVTAVIAILMTSVVVFSLAPSSRYPTGKRWTIESFVLIAMYILGSVTIYYLSTR